MAAGLAPRDFACTWLGVVATEALATVIQIGDGGVAIDMGLEDGPLIYIVLGMTMIQRVLKSLHKVVQVGRGNLTHLSRNLRSYS